MRSVTPTSPASVEAIEAVYEQSYHRFLRVALAMLGDLEQARDAVQETFARAITARTSFRGEGRLDAWLWGALINICRTAQRSSSRNGSIPHPEPVAPSEPVADDDVRSAIRALPERQRVVLFLRHYADLSYDQIAEAIDVQRGTVAATLHGAHESLRRTILEVR